MILSDFHVHTNFGDGKNSPEEIVLTAINRGLTAIGFSEHAYVPFDSGYCLTPETSVTYRNEINRLKKKYENKIKILCGIEADSFADCDYENYDYVIGSVHYLSACGNVYSVDLSKEETMRCVSEAFGNNFDSFAEAYYEEIYCLYEKIKPNIIGHFDLITKFKKSGISPTENSPRYVNAWKSVLEKIGNKVTFEVNTGAISRGYRLSPYPSKEILSYLAEQNTTLILSSDSHEKNTLCYKFNENFELLTKLGFTHFGFYNNQNNFIKQ